MKQEKNLPAIDDADLRTHQAKKVADGIHEMGQYAKELKRTTQINMIVGLLVTFGLIAAVIVGLVAGGGIQGVVDVQSSKRSFTCDSRNHQIQDTVRTYEQARAFVELYGGRCELHIKGQK